MSSLKILVPLVLLAVSVNCMTKQFQLTQNEKNIILEASQTSEPLQKDELRSLFIDVIIRTMQNYNWQSDTFPQMFSEEILASLLGDQKESILAKDLEAFVEEGQFSKIYQNYFKKVVSFLAKSLEQDQADLEENFEIYSLSFDTYYILNYSIPKAN
ncbi:hypothetical protein ABPG72_000194 [Tetrahymena utriculariae]